MNYYISDLHLGCEEIAIRTGRTLKNDIPAMNKHIIDVINETCTKDDMLFLLGDVSCFDYNPVEDLKKINTRMILIAGNHDKRWLRHKSFRNCFVDIYDKLIVKENDKKVFLSHYPMAEWDGFYKGIYHFYGHIHNSKTGAANIMALYERACNVSYDKIGKPMTFEELMEEHKNEMANQETDPLKIMEHIMNGLKIEGRENATDTESTLQT